MREGERIGGYQLVRRIGEGGMGSVWIATHEVLGRRAAIKLLHPEHSTLSTAVTRFFNEARAATAISDPGIVQIFDVGYHDGRAYIVMELLEGEPLDARLRREGVLAAGPALRLCRQLASTIGAAHARGIVHRDLKPENIIVVRDPEVVGGERAKVLDFGIAKLAGDLGAHIKTRASAILGTPPYMSPEQCRGAGQVDHRSDIYSLGCVLFALVTGRPPFDARSSGVLLMQHIADEPPRPSSCARGVPPEVDELILRCLAKHPDSRFASGAELARAIDALLAIPSVAAAAAGTPGTLHLETTRRSSSGDTSPTLAAATPHRRRRYAALAAVVIIPASVVAALIASAGASRDAADASSRSTASTPSRSGAAAVTAAPVASPLRPDPRPAQARADLRALLVQFSIWAADHAAAPCPTSSDVFRRTDPWGHAYELTCTDQPADQVAGVRSSGLDGVMRTDDDLVSWLLDDVMTVARGPRWTPTVDRSAPVSRSRPQAETRQHEPRAQKPDLSSGSNQPESDGMVDLDGDGIPDSR